MKRINQILIYSIIVIITFSSCNKHDEKALLTSVNEQIMGRYKCKSITFLGDPIDIDNDGNTSTNIINEFSKYDYTREIINTPLRIAPAGNYDYSMLINMEIPIQNIRFDKKHNKYSTKDYSKKSSFISFSYSIGKDGLLSFSVYQNKEIAKEDYDGIIEGIDLDYRNTYGIEIVKLGNGIFEAKVACMFYDFATSSIVKGQAIYRYERFLYSLF